MAGIQGPTIRSEIGDLIEILFTNKLTRNYASIHSMGLAYSKENEGALYPNATSSDPHVAPVRGDAVPPGECVVYKWVVPESSAPPPKEPASMNGYHSYVSEAEDVFTGLIGPQMTYHRGKMNQTISKYREFPILFLGFDESSSFLSGVNAAALNSKTGNFSTIPSDLFMYGNQSFWLPQLINVIDARNFDGAPTFQVVNGWVYSNNPTFTMCLNEDVIWYVYAYGTDSHVFHLHGNGVVQHGINEVSVDINDGIMATLFMQATNSGLWQLICHITEHLQKGMVANYWVKDDCPPLKH